MNGGRLTDELVAAMRHVHDDWQVWELLSEAQASRKLVADLRALHRPFPVLGEEAPWCSHDGFTWPCPTIRLIDEAGL